MALLFCDGFDHFDAIDILKKWTSVVNFTPVVGGDVNCSTQPAWARPPGGQGLRLGGSSNRQLQKTLATNYATFIWGCNIYCESSATGNNPFAVFLDGASLQVELRIDATGHLVLTRNGTVLATSTNVFSASTWYHVEAKVTINNTTGAYEVRVNGSATGWIAAATGANTRSTANNYINSMYITPGGAAGQSMRFDDLYILDSSGSLNNTFIGPQKIITCYPNGVGNYAQWAGNYAANFSNVNESTGDSDSTFNQSSTAGQLDSFVFDDVPTGTIAAVQQVLMARQDAGAARVIAPLQRSSATDYVGTNFNLAGSYVFLCDPKDANPDTAAAWTVAGFNAAEFGYKEIS